LNEAASRREEGGGKGLRMDFTLPFFLFARSCDIAKRGPVCAEPALSR
jgi:hypothetical protein